MFELLKDTHIDFMGTRRIWLTISAVLVLGSLVILPIRGLNLGIEFTGGTEIQVKYVDRPDTGAIRSALREAGLVNNLVTTIGDPKENEVYIRLGAEPGSAEEKGQEKDYTQRVMDALRSEEVRSRREAGLVDLNAADEAILRTLLEASPDLAAQDAQLLAKRIADKRKEVAVFRSADDLVGIEGMTPQAQEHIRARAFVGPFAIRSQSFIGPTIGRELVRKALLAVLGSLAAMLAYIGIRFKFRWGFAAVVAVAHDTIVTLGLFSLFGKEMSLPVVAAFLTLIGYSVNDTVVIFDRVRENLKLRGGENLETLINQSVNQTLSRTILTSGLTWIVALALFFFAGEALNPFAFVLAVGIVIGSYSTIYIASPILVLWQQFLDRFKGRKEPKGPASQKKAKKVRASASVR